MRQTELSYNKTSNLIELDLRKTNANRPTIRTKCHLDEDDDAIKELAFVKIILKRL